MKLKNNFLNFLYYNYIYEDFSYLNKLGKIFIKPAWVIRTIIVGSLIFVIMPLFYIRYKLDGKIEEIKKEIKSLRDNFIFYNELWM